MTAIQGTSIRQPTFLRERKTRREDEGWWWVVAAWALHFVLTISVVLMACFDNNGTRKYISINAKKLPPESGCRRAFLNVLEDNQSNAIFCCGDDHLLSDSILCKPPPAFMLFARRLSRLPDAVLIPLFPVILQFAVHCYQKVFSASTPPSGAAEEQLVRTKRRSWMYLGLILLRTFILYVFMDQLENIIVPADPNEMCWYRHLTQSSIGTCHGRSSDFSDHIVLYFAQLLPLALMEVVHWMQCTFASSRKKDPSNETWVLLSVMVGGLAHLYVITCYNAYKTTAYFHTGPEILAGYLVSLIVQVPLCLLQTTNVWPGLRSYYLEPEPASELKIAE